MLGPNISRVFTSKRRPLGKERIHHLHISHNMYYLPPKILHNLCFSFLLGITAIPRKKENNAYGNFFCGGGGGGLIRCIMEDILQVANRTIITSVCKIVFCLPSWPQTCHKYRFGGR